MQTNPKDQAREIVRISGVDARKCMKCGKCSAACPAFNEMDVHPHSMVKMVEEGNIQKLLNTRSFYKCLSCFACVERCPRSVEPAKLMEALRLADIRRQGANHMDADDIPGLLNDMLPQQLIVSVLRKYSK